MTGMTTTSLPNPLPDELVELIARRFRVIGEPMRISCSTSFESGEATVLALTAAVGASQQNVSKHLGVLYDAGIVVRRKEGTQVLLPRRRRRHLRALRDGVRQRAAPGRRAERDLRGDRTMTWSSWPLERVLFAHGRHGHARQRRCSPSSSRPGSCC